MYRPPNVNINFSQYLEKLFEKIDQNFYDVICFLGDLNINFVKSNNGLNPEANEVKENFLYYGLEQVVQRPRYSVSNPKSILDILFTNNKENIDNLEVIQNISKSCDHFSLSFDINIYKPKNLIKTKTKIFYNSESLFLINDELFSINWFSIKKNLNNIELVYEIMKNGFENVLNKYLRSVEETIYNRKPFNAYIRSLIKNRRNLLKYKLKTFNFTEKYDFLTKRIGREIEKFE